MILVPNRNPETKPIDTDVLIIGAGPAGIVIALELAHASIDTVLIEAGGEKTTRKTSSMLRGSLIGLPSTPLTRCRSACLGGTSERWTGWCRPLDPIDFEPEAGRGYGSWPMRREELRRWYTEANQWVELPSEVMSETASDAAPGWHFANGAVETRRFLFSPPTHFGRQYSRQLQTTNGLRVLPHACALHLESTKSGRCISNVPVALASGSRTIVHPRHVILAAGGIENARLLMQSGIGTEHGLVGRFFMEHAYSFTGWFEPAEGVDPTRHSLPRSGRINSILAMGLSADAQRRFDLNNSFSFLVPRPRFKAHVDFNRPGVQALCGLVDDAREGRLPSSPGRRLTTLALDFPAVVRTAGRFAFGENRNGVSYGLRTCVEQSPSPQSRVLLSTRHTDRWGRPRPVLDWRLDERCRRTLLSSTRILRDAIESAGFGRLHLYEDGGLASHGWPATLTAAGHHMGTTRMHPNPRWGVVDETCRVHGVDNLFVAGSSVFPTAGASNPTLTIIALSLRLANHLRELSSRSPAAVG